VVTTSSRVLQSPGWRTPSANSTYRLPVSYLSVRRHRSSLTSGGTTFNGSAGPFQVFALGGPSGSEPTFPTHSWESLRVYPFGFRRELYRLPALLGRGIYWGGWYEAELHSERRLTIPARSSSAVPSTGVIADTIVGPVTLAGSISPTGQSRVNFSIGRLF
jgi:hypothetical protein